MHYFDEARESRTAQALKNRWYTISHDVSKFVSCHRNITLLNQSGKTGEGDKILYAKILYREKHREEFNFEACWRILRHCQKFLSGDEPTTPTLTCTINLDVNVDGNSPETEISTPDTTYTLLSRPIGRKKALKFEREDKYHCAIKEIASSSKAHNTALELH
jgi:hypothetical protein